MKTLGISKINMKARYFIQFSYVGTHFRSSEKIWLKEGRNYPDPKSVQGVIELGLLKFRSLNYPNLVLSSRTDGGVHALNSTAHFDLEKFGSNIIEPCNVAYELNKYFYKNEYPIFVKKCLRVPDNFSARFNAKSRTYLYRIAFYKKGIDFPVKFNLANYIPIEEWKRCLFLKFSDIDIEKIREACKYFVGYHDFTTFKKQDKLNSHKQNRRELYSIDVMPGQPQVTCYTSQQESVFNYWDFVIRGRSFVHNQIRRMIGTLISVGVGKLPSEEIKVMLQVPSKHSWYSFIQSAPPDGLYLCDVEYDPVDLVYEPIVSNQCVTKDNCETDSDSE